MRPAGRARYFGVAVPEYFALNPWLTPDGSGQGRLTDEQDAAVGLETGAGAADPGGRADSRSPRGPEQGSLSGEAAWSRSAFLRAAVEERLDRVIRVVRLPVTIEPELAAAAIGDMARLRQAGDLTALRGGRPTDLPRPLPAALAARVQTGCPGLVELLRRVEAALAGSRLFVRAVKLDAARASTTQPRADLAAEHLHFDAERSSLSEYREPIFQYYANAARLPRLFRVLPLPLPELLEALTESGGLRSGEGKHLPLREILDRFTAGREVVLERIPVPGGCLALFDGRSFAHDAGKPDLDALLAGRFEPAAEADLVLALDSSRIGHHRGRYDPERPLLADTG